MAPKVPTGSAAVLPLRGCGLVPGAVLCDAGCPSAVPLRDDDRADSCARERQSNLASVSCTEKKMEGSEGEECVSTKS